MDIQAMKNGQRQMWSSGHFTDIARMIESAGIAAVNCALVVPGDRVLDVATGSGNVAIPAAEKGAQVTGLDITPELLEVARGRATEAGVEVEFVEGDAEDLPYADDSFDKVISVFGAMFAPRHDVAAGEIARVLRPGGRFVVAAWTPEGMNGQLLTTVGSHMPPPPEAFAPPVLWGTEAHLEWLFADDDIELTFERRDVVFEADSTDEYFDEFERKLGPMVMARSALEPQGKYAPLREDLLALFDRFNVADDGTFLCRAEYLMTTGAVA